VTIKFYPPNVTTIAVLLRRAHGRLTARKEYSGEHMQLHGIQIWHQFAAAGVCLAATCGLSSSLTAAERPPQVSTRQTAVRGSSPVRLMGRDVARVGSGTSESVQPVSSLAVETQPGPLPVRDEFLKPEDVVNVTPIDLPSALQLAGVQNPQIAIAYQRVLATTARQQLAAARWLPNINVGTNYDAHTGALQQPSGNILNVNRDSLYVGAGGNAVGSGTVNVPGIQFNFNVSQTIYNSLISQQLTEQSRFANRAMQNDVQLQVASAYAGLLRAEGLRAIAFQTRDNAREVARVTRGFAKVGQGREADADRAETELSRREGDLLATEASVLTASARLSQLVLLETSTRLHPTDNWVVPRVIVPDVIPLPELLAISLYQRPELGARRSAVHAAMLGFDAAKMLPFSPQIIAGFSAGDYGGGSNLITDEPRFGRFAPRADVNVVAYWSLQNLGFGNKAQIDAARSRVRSSDLEQLIVLNQVRAEVADAFARVQTLQAQLEIRRQAVESSQAAFREDFIRSRQNEGRPIEVLDSLRLLDRSRTAYLNALVDFNAAQFGLYTALGQPPADLLVRPAN
jgi:outer membrane protein TolC